jgi:hypothetical protein
MSRKFVFPFVSSILTAFFVSFFPAMAHASDIYIAQNMAGTNTGTNCADAYAVSFFNKSSDWGTGAGQIGPGTTVHLCGTFTDNTQGDTMLQVLGSGKSGSPITILFESGAMLSSTAYWGSNGAINLNGNSWVTIDGAHTGVVQNTSNGTGLAFARASTGLYLSHTNNVTVQNLTIANICQHKSSSDTNACNSGGVNDQAVKITGGAVNLLLQGDTIHDSQNCIELYGSAGDTVTIKNNTISRCNWGIGGYGLSTSLTITGNDISGNPGGLNPWGTTADTFHNNGIMLFPQSGNMSGVVIADNYIHDIGGSTGSSGTETGHIFFDPGGTGNIPNALILNNVLTTSGSSSYGPTNAYITDGQGTSGVSIYNNTIVGSGPNPGLACISNQINTTVENNICQGVDVGEWLNTGYTGVISNFNAWYNLPGDGAGIMCANSGSKCEPTVAAWTSAFGFDTSSINGNPNLTGSFALNSGSSAVAKGVNLSNLGITSLNVSAPQTFGANYACGSGCIARPSSSAWDIGAYEFSGLGSPTNVSGQAVSVP